MKSGFSHLDWVDLPRLSISILVREMTITSLKIQRETKSKNKKWSTVHREGVGNAIHATLYLAWLWNWKNGRILGVKWRKSPYMAKFKAIYFWEIFSKFLEWPKMARNAKKNFGYFLKNAKIGQKSDFRGRFFSLIAICGNIRRKAKNP